MSTEPIAQFFDRECCATAHPDASLEYDEDAVSEMLLSLLSQAGFAGGTVLELGSGDGSLSRELVRRGAQAVIGLDLSAQSVNYATDAAARAGVSDRLSYKVADAASDPLEAHDAVVSERVFCCYPDATALLANTLAAARSIYVLVLPESRGLAGLVTRVAIRIENAWRWLRRDPFRAYVHDVRVIERAIRDAGFRRRASRRTSHWRGMAFSRP